MLLWLFLYFTMIIAYASFSLYLSRQIKRLNLQCDKLCLRLNNMVLNFINIGLAHWSMVQTDLCLIDCFAGEIGKLPDMSYMSQ